MDPAIILFGLGVGLLVGATGMGGGSLMTPLLILLFGINPVVAVGTDLAYAAVTKTVGGWRHLRKGTVDLTVSTWMALGSVPGALGAFVGFVLGITSAGSGTLISIGLIIGFRLTPRRVVGTDVAHAAVLTWPSSSADSRSRATRPGRKTARYSVADAASISATATAPSR